MANPLEDPIVGKVVIDFSRKYVSVYFCDGDGSIRDFDHFRYPFLLDRKDAVDECRDTYHFLYQYLNDSMNVDINELQEGGGEGSE